MSFFAILLALLIEQVRPLSRGNPVHTALRHWALWVGRNFDAGRFHHGWIAWSIAVLLPAVLSFGVHALLLFTLGWLAAVVWAIVVLYATLGFRQFSHHFTGIRDALLEGDEAGARERLAQWQQVDASELPRSEVVRHVIEYSVLAAHRHVFGVLAWYAVGAACGLGPMGAVLYRMAEFVARYWRYKGLRRVQPASAALQRAAAAAWTVIDWLPARLTALGFAVVGSFEEAIDGWRYHAQRFPNDNDGVILAATSGALGVRLGGGVLRTVVELPEAALAEGEAGIPGVASAGAGAGDVAAANMTPGREPEISHLAQVVGLVWRSVIVWMGLLLLLSLARLLG